LVYSTQPDQQSVELSFVDTGEVAGRHYYYARLLQQDGMIAWSSPLFANWE
jgi:hypothetical protein